MSRLQIIAAGMILLLGLGVLAALLNGVRADLQFYFTASPMTVRVDRVDLQTQWVTDPTHASQSLEMEAELSLSTASGPRLVWEFFSGSAEATQRRADALRRLQGQTLTLFLSDAAPRQFALTLRFPWQRLLALTIPLIVLILPSTWVLGRHFASRSTHA